MGKEQRISPGGYLVDPRYHHEYHQDPRTGYWYDVAWGTESFKVYGMILNFESGLFCSEERLGYCQLDNPSEECYAKVRERQYWQPWELAEKQREVWRDLDADTIADLFIKSLSRGERLYRAVSPLGFLKIRQGERGGLFGGQALLEKADYVLGCIIRFAAANGVKAKAQLFTSRPDLDISRLQWLTVRKSGLAGPRYHGRAVMYYSRADVPKGYILCKEDCRICAACHIRGRDIALIYHDALTAKEKSRTEEPRIIVPKVWKGITRKAA